MAKAYSGRVAYFNGDYLPESDIRLSIEDRAFKYGDMAFDVTRTFAGRPFKLDQHIHRLWTSLRYLRIEPLLHEAELIAISLRVLEENLHLLYEGEDYWLRQYVSRGFDAPSHRARDAGPPTVFVRCEPLDFALFAEGYIEGVNLVTPSVRRTPAQCIDPKAKVANYVNQIIAELEVPENTVPLMLDVDGLVAEAGMMNFFLARNGIVETPALGSALPGVSRETVLELCDGLGMPARETSITLHDVYSAEEAFVTATSFCILPVRSINGRAVNGGKLPGPLTLTLLEAWSELVGVDFVEQARANAAKTQQHASS